MKLLKTIRFDASDERAFDLAAAPEEWAVAGAFAFAGAAPNSLAGKSRQAFANGFLGVASFGRSTFAAVADATAADLDQIEQALAHHFISTGGAPNEAAARSAAAEETLFVSELCRDVSVNTVFTVRRTWDAQGQIKEEFRTIRPPTGEPQHARIWTVVDDEA
jgi:Family of unknown function (DUF6505)